MSITIVATARQLDCPTCGSLAGQHCVTSRLCSARLHAASKRPHVVRETALSLMYSDPFTRRLA